MTPNDTQTPAAAERRGPSTRAVYAGLPAPERAAPFLPGPVMAATYHFSGDIRPEEGGYGRDVNPTWTALEAAVGALDGGDCLIFPSGMAAIAAVLGLRSAPGDVVVLPSDGYNAVRRLAADRLQARGVEVRLVPTATEAIVAALPGADLALVESPSNPALDVCDLRTVASAARAAGTLLAVDNTLATPLGQRPLALGADIVVMSGTKMLTGHSDMLLGTVSTRDGAALAALRDDRSHGGAIVGPFEAWLAHRSLATLGVRVERQCANALALAQMLRGRSDVSGVRYPGLPDDPSHAVAARQMECFGPLVGFELDGADRAQAFLAACTLVAEATSFGGVHSMAERRARWGGDAVAPGFIRFSCGLEDTADLLADVGQALDRVR